MQTWPVFSPLPHVYPFALSVHCPLVSEFALGHGTCFQQRGWQKYDPTRRLKSACETTFVSPHLYQCHEDEPAQASLLERKDFEKQGQVSQSSRKPAWRAEDQCTTGARRSSEMAAEPPDLICLLFLRCQLEVFPSTHLHLQHTLKGIQSGDLAQALMF